MKISFLFLLFFLSFNSITKAHTQDWWKPKVQTKWAIQFTNTPILIIPEVDVQNVDLYDTDQIVINTLHEKGKKVICYFSAGSFENWRSDAADFPSDVIGKNLAGWEGEKWLDIRRLDILVPIMTKRFNLAVEKKCDGIDVDNLDGYTQKSGFILNYMDQIIYNKMLATKAHERGLGIGLKNDLNQILDLVNDYDWAINEECFQYQECHLLIPFIEKGKPVLNIEYKGKISDFCPQANELKFSSIKKKLSLDGWFESCSKM
jgi:hypothetical protein